LKVKQYSSSTTHPTQVNAPRITPAERLVVYSINLPRRDGRLSWPRWLVWFTHLQNRPSINWFRRRATTLIKTNALPLSQATCFFNRYNCATPYGLYGFAVSAMFNVYRL